MLIERKEIKNEDGSIGYIESIFKSENILKTTYFPLTKKLYISFGRGGVYSYSNITTKLYDEFENADSHGKFFRKKIYNKDEYPFRKEFTLYPNEVKDIKENINKLIDENECDDI